ncbi:MAG: transglycosylase SLT domain-containing protein [Bacteroidales bacterium]|nr:transglycosylase SLT domain-containing protein [Bacteroidales bacterium]MCF8389454.1 transglycosylase SLT domain-containing protein [Bacteroidales bacterium]
MKFKYLAIILSLTLVSGILFFVNPLKSDVNSEEKVLEEPTRAYAIFAVSIPEAIEFSGEQVPLDQVDVREALDREILVNTYWQSQTLLFLKRANRYFPTIEKILREYNVPDDFKYLAVAESGLMNVVSPSQAVGFWQLLEGTAVENGLEVNNEVDERYHLEKSTEAACRYILESYEKYKSWTMAAASYNAGRRGIDRQVDRQIDSDYYDLLFTEETSRYIFRILAIKLILTSPGDYGFYIGVDDLYHEVPSFEVTIDGKVDNLAEFAKRYHITYKTLKNMNPWLREANLSNPKNHSYYVKIPRKGFFDPTRAEIPVLNEETTN